MAAASKCGDGVTLGGGIAVRKEKSSVAYASGSDRPSLTLPARREIFPALRPHCARKKLCLERQFYQARWRALIMSLLQQGLSRLGSSNHGSRLGLSHSSA